MAQYPLKTTNSPNQNRDRRNHLVMNDGACYSSSATQVSSVALVFDGENMMLRRTMLKMPSKTEPAQRKSLFRTQGKAYGELCKIIVDSRSTENVASLEMAENCKLKRLLHLAPHKISFLNKSHSFTVEEEAWVEFELSEYKDRVLCEIILMDACHLILGGPWQYDVKVQHNGEKNTYLIEKDGR